MASRALTRPHPLHVLDRRPQSVSLRSVRGGDRVRPPSPILARVRDEFGEMPGLSPTLEQAARLFSLTPDACNRVFTELLTEGFLGRGPDGRYRLMTRR